MYIEWAKPWKNIFEVISERKKVVSFYLENLNFSILKTIKIREKTDWNNSYFPVIFKTEEQLLSTQKTLNENDIFPRRYFYPSLNTIEYNNGKSMPISESISSRIMCLPLYVGLTTEELNKIITITNKTLC